jgi:hypothetical protein
MQGNALPELPLHLQFERQVERIHRLLESDGAQITWDDHIPDPDNPIQGRQIDISIRRNSSLTLIECRLHKEPQNVTWIEELIGRRISLKADGVIAVSASGFTITAQKKAQHHGIILRDFAALSDDEIRDWGLKRRISISYCEFSQLTYTINVNRKFGSFPRITAADGMSVSPLNWYFPLQEIMKRLDVEGWDGTPATIHGLIDNPPLADGERSISLNISAETRRILEDVSVSSVHGYIDPLNAQRIAEVGKFNLGTSEFIEHRDSLATLVDLSQITIPDGCLFETVMTDAGRSLTMQLSHPVGMVATVRCRIPIIFRVLFSEGSQYHSVEVRRMLIVDGSERADGCGELTLNAALLDCSFAAPL